MKSEIKKRVKSLMNLIDLADRYETVQVSYLADDNFLSDIQNHEFIALQKLLESKAWPVAINPSMICDESDNEAKLMRAEAIIDMLIKTPLEGKKFLDYGCGEGHVVIKASELSAFAMGYDIKSHDWTSRCTTSFEEVVQNAPFDVILIYDVMDHSHNTLEVLQQAKQVLAPNGKVYLRTHPWCGRHGGHLYRQINKAFAHLVFSEEELRQMGYQAMPTTKVIHPILAYNNVIQQSGLQIISQNITKEIVEPFFTDNPTIAGRIKACWAGSHELPLREAKSFPMGQMEQQFHDYVLAN